MDDKTWLYWQRRLVEAERRIEKLEAQQNAFMVENVGDYLTVDQMAKLAEQAGFSGIGKYNWGVHVDVRKTPARWDYRK